MTDLQLKIRSSFRDHTASAPRYPVADWKVDEFPSCFRGKDLLRISNDVTDLFLAFTLFVEQQLRVTDPVHEQDMADQ